jgi:hypothetical protein
VKFLPFVEGETILLVTNHAALQWAQTYKNTNHRLAAWGAVFATYASLHIIHRPGRVHSNVDPLLRLPRETPEFVGPVMDASPSIDLGAEVLPVLQAGGEQFGEEHVTATAAAALATRIQPTQVKKGIPAARLTFEIPGRSTKLPSTTTKQSTGILYEMPKVQEIQPKVISKEPDTTPSLVVSPHQEEAGLKEWEYDCPLPYLHVGMDNQACKQWVAAYKQDTVLYRRWSDLDSAASTY